MALAVGPSGEIYTTGYNDVDAPNAPGDIIVNKFTISVSGGIGAGTSAPNLRGRSDRTDPQQRAGVDHP